MGAPITAIETRYAGCRFRSRLEARWAVFFDALDIPWKYEPQGYVVDGEPYLPDFWIGDDYVGDWVEVKGTLDRAALALLAAAAGPNGLPLCIAEDSKRPADLDFGEHGWIHLSDPVLTRLLILGDVPDPSLHWVHPRLDLVNGLHIVHQPVTWWSAGPEKGMKLVQLDRAHRVLADPDPWLPHGIEFHPLAHNRRVSEAYRAARSARFEHGESGGG